MSMTSICKSGVSRPLDRTSERTCTPPDSVNLMALPTILMRICLSLSGSLWIDAGMLP